MDSHFSSRPFPNHDLARMTTLLVATRNAHKVQEIGVILDDNFQFLALNDFPTAPATVEDAEDVAGNATNKAA